MIGFFFVRFKVAFDSMVVKIAYHIFIYPGKSVADWESNSSL